MKDISKYEVRGYDVESLWRGLTAVGVPAAHQAHIIDCVRTVLSANEVEEIVWYMIESRQYLCVAWTEQNALGVNGHSMTVHESIEMPLTVNAMNWNGWRKHHFPWATASTRSHHAPKATAPLPCQVCFNPHAPGDECF